MHGLQTYAVIAAFRIHAQCGEDAAKRGGHILNSHGNYILDHGKSWKNHGIVFLNFCGNPVFTFRKVFNLLQVKFQL